MDHHVSSAMQSSTDLLSTAVWRDYCFGVSCCCYVSKRYERPPPECHCDPEVVGFSHVGQAVYQTLRRKHFWYHKSLWNVSTGRVVAIHATPHVRPPEDLNRKAFASSTAVTPPSSTSTSRIQQQQQRLPLPLPPGHTDWFPEHLGNLVSRTEEWCDILNLGPPDGLFLHHFAKALQQLHAKNKPIVIRMMFGHVLGMPINCKAVVRRLTSNLPAENTKLRLWVGAWRKGVSWNHSKIVAVDGFVVLTGGHNLWDLHYLRSNPVHDVSIELEGQVAQDAHFYANEQWKFLEKMDNSCFGSCITKVQDYAPVIFKTYVSLRRFPLTAPRHPPNYVKQLLLRGRFPRRAEQVPIISMGRNGALTRFQRRPSDDAIVAMLDSATTSCKLALQDLGPVTIPGTKITVPGCVWPHAYLSALGRILWQRNVKIQLILSNPQSVPGGLTLLQAVYGNGWTCVDVAAEIIKAIRKQFPKVDDYTLREKVNRCLQVCYLRGPSGQRTWDENGLASMGFHAKHFIIDDLCYYLGSQNLYIADLAEWGLVVDNVKATRTMLDEFWDPLWERSYHPDDCNVQEVMDGLAINRDGERPSRMSAVTKQRLESVQQSVQHAAPDGGGGRRRPTSLLEMGKAGSIYQHRMEDLYLEDEDDDNDDDDDDDKRRGPLLRFVSRRNLFRSSA